MKNRTTTHVIQLFTFALCLTICNNITAQSSVKIGTQEWTTQNLDVSTFRNGDSIPEAKTRQAWLKAGEDQTPAWCYYNNDTSIGHKCGKLYNWYAVNDPRGLAPSGWRIPSDSDWTVLANHLGGWMVAGKKMKSQEGWHTNQDYDYEKNIPKGEPTPGTGNNKSGFSGLPCGYRLDDGNFSNKDVIQYFGQWWSTTHHAGTAIGRVLSSDGGSLDYSNYAEESGLNVRCIRN